MLTCDSYHLLDIHDFIYFSKKGVSMKIWIGIFLVIGSKLVMADDRVVLEFSPFHLAKSFFEFSLEKPLDDNSSMTFILGRGESRSDETIEITTTVWGFGSQYRYYINQQLEGLHIGAEVYYIMANASEDDFKAEADGFSIGPMLGWKAQWDFGLVLNFQLGYQKLFVTADASDNGGNSASGEISTDLLLLNLNVGWSF